MHGTRLALLRAVPDDRANPSDKLKKRADAWSSLQHAALTNEAPDPLRWYDRRHQQVDITRERAQSEALQASELATQYISDTQTHPNR